VRRRVLWVSVMEHVFYGVDLIPLVVLSLVDSRIWITTFKCSSLKVARATLTTHGKTLTCYHPS
jgi:hypothetical protein